MNNDKDMTQENICQVAVCAVITRLVENKPLDYREFVAATNDMFDYRTLENICTGCKVEYLTVVEVNAISRYVDVNPETTWKEICRTERIIAMEPLGWGEDWHDFVLRVTRPIIGRTHDEPEPDRQPTSRQNETQPRMSEARRVADRLWDMLSNEIAAGNNDFLDEVITDLKNKKTKKS